MKRLETHKQREKRHKRNRIFIGTVIIFLMVFSTLGYALLNRSNPDEEQEQTYTSEYNGQTFNAVSGGWLTKINFYGQERELFISYFPEQLENISINQKPILSDLYGKALYITMNDSSGEKQAANEFISNLNNVFLRAQLSCSLENSGSDYCIDNDLPIKTCMDVNQKNFILILRETLKETDSEAEVNYQTGCLTISGNSEELIKAVDKILFLLFEIMNR